MKRILLLVLLSSMHVNAQSLNELFKKSVEASEKKDYKTFLTLTQRMDSIRPMHPKISYSLASAYTLNDDQESAFKVLKRIVLMDSGTNIEKDDVFKPFIQTQYYNELQKLRQELNVPVIHSKKVITLDEKTLHTEGLLWVKDQGWLAVSIRKRKIVSFDSKTGKCSDWLAQKDMLAVFSIKTSKDGRYLWAATGAVPEMENFDAALDGKAEVLKIDIAARKIIQRFSVEGGHLFGDLLVTDSGQVYVSDSRTVAIYKIEDDAISQWLNLQNEAYNLQGITMDEKESKLFVADYLKGILAISTKDNTRRNWFIFPEGTTPKGIDGLTYYNNSLIAIHNGVTPIRIIQYKVNAKKDALTDYEVLDSNRPEFNEPVLGTIHENNFYFFANAPWKAYDKNAALNEGMVTNPELFVLPLKK